MCIYREKKPPVLHDRLHSLHRGANVGILTETTCKNTTHDKKLTRH